MIITLTDTTARQIAASLLKARRNLGPANGMVHTLVVVAEEEHYDEVLEAAMDAGRAHPSRIIVLSYTEADAPRLDAELHSGESVPGDVIVLRVYGELRAHADSVVLPLLLPDSPTVVWWPHNAPTNLAADSVGALATRRITDAAGSADPQKALLVRAANLSPGDTDLTWTRLTPWRGLIAASLDQHPCSVTGATVEAAPDNAPATLMRTWLKTRLGVEVAAVDTPGPGITAVRLHTDSGDIAVIREDGFMASYVVPSQVRRSVALKRRSMTQLLTEELQRMDPDEVFETVIAELLEER